MTAAADDLAFLPVHELAGAMAAGRPISARIVETSSAGSNAAKASCRPSSRSTRRMRCAQRVPPTRPPRRAIASGRSTASRSLPAIATGGVTNPHDGSGPLLRDPEFRHLWTAGLVQSVVNGITWAADNPLRRGPFGDVAGFRRMGAAMARLEGNRFMWPSADLRGRIGPQSCSGRPLRRYYFRTKEKKHSEQRNARRQRAGKHQ